MSKLGTVFPVLLLVLELSVTVAAQSRNVGELLEVRGRVEIRRGKQPRLKGTGLSLLQAGDRLRVGKSGSTEVVLFRNGARFRLAAGSRATVAALTLKPSSGPTPMVLPGLNLDFVRAAGRPAPPLSPRLRAIRGGFLVRGSGRSNLGPHRPVPDGAVRASPVTLRWTGPVSGDSLHMEISDGERTVFATDPDLPPTARAFTLPEGVLRPERDYVWSVREVRGARNGRSCGGLVRLLTPEEKAEVERLEAEAAAPAAAAPEDPDLLLLLARVYERLRLYDEARSAYLKVLRVRPDDVGTQGALRHLREEASR